MRMILCSALAATAILSACGSDRTTALGRALFAQNCAICHGADARGGGGANVPGLGKTPPDLTRLTLTVEGDFPRAMVIDILDGYASGTHAGRRMVPFRSLQSRTNRRVRTSGGRVLVPAPQSALLAYLETLQR